MDTSPQKSPARVAAIVALIVALILLVWVISSSTGGGSDENGGGGGKVERQKGQRSKRKVYVVKPGDSLSTIADKLGVSVEELQRLNPGIDPQALRSGERVKLR